MTELKYKIFQDERFNKALKFLEEATNKYIKDGNSVGGGYVITTSKNILAKNVYGFDDKEKDQLMREDSTILLASVSKTISGALICFFQHMYDNDITETNSGLEFSDKYLTENVTAKDLIVHRSGIQEQFGTLHEAMHYTRDEIMKFIPNTENKGFRNILQYTNLPFTHGINKTITSLGYNLSKAYKMFFNDVGMHNTTIDYEENKYKGYIDSCITDNTKNKWIPSFNYSAEEQVSAGGIYSTLDDMQVFLQYLLKGIPNDNGFHTAIACAGDKYKGFGTNIKYTIIFNKLFKTYGHSGGLENVRTLIWWVPELDIGMFIWTNSSPNGFPEALLEGFLSILNDGDYQNVYENVYDAVTKLITDMISPITYFDSGTYVNVDTFDGIYLNRLYGYLIIKNGIIKFGKMGDLRLKLDDDGYYFMWMSKYNVTYKSRLNFDVNNVTVYVWDIEIKYAKINEDIVG